MGYRGLPVRKHSARDPFRRPRGLDFRVCDFPEFLSLFFQKKLFIFIYHARRRETAGPQHDCWHRAWSDGLRLFMDAAGQQWIVDASIEKLEEDCMLERGTVA
jgi:hypothetical protein